MKRSEQKRICPDLKWYESITDDPYAKIKWTIIRVLLTIGAVTAIVGTHYGWW